ncbi:MAG: cytochrome c [Myxococcales bacterium FL481]|nr:MAG: cytochrome c [Myxococcales bacterium FL481]
MTRKHRCPSPWSIPFLASLWLTAPACENDDSDEDDDGHDHSHDETVPDPYAGRTNPNAPDDPSALAAGQALFEANCGCHGASGTGADDATDLTTPTAAAWPDDLWLWRVSDGLGQAMPAFKGNLSEDQIWQVITYCRTLAG